MEAGEKETERGKQCERRWWDERRFCFCSVLYFVYSRSSHIWHVPCSILRFTKFSLSFPLTARIREGLRGGHTLWQQHIEMREIEKSLILHSCVLILHCRLILHMFYICSVFTLEKSLTVNMDTKNASFSEVFLMHCCSTMHRWCTANGGETAWKKYWETSFKSCECIWIPK